MGFKKANKRKVYLKLAITGPSGSGKTYSALRLASGIKENAKIAVIDTENGSASLYADHFNFDVWDIDNKFNHTEYLQAITESEKAGYDVLIIDSASHFWEAILEQKQKMDDRGGNSYTNWGKAGAIFKKILDAVLFSKMHVIACMRSKMEYVLEKDAKGRQVPKKVGLAPIMRDGIEFEFTTVFELDMQHRAQASKDRTQLFQDQIFLIEESTGQKLIEWRDSGEGEAYAKSLEKVPTARPATPPESIEKNRTYFVIGQEEKDFINSICRQYKFGKEHFKLAIKELGIPVLEEMSEGQYKSLCSIIADKSKKEEYDKALGAEMVNNA